jgi:putative ATP-grasp target RiPP
MNGDLCHPAYQFPLGGAAGISDVSDEMPSSRETRPFGLQYLTDPAPDGGDGFNWASLSYDHERQIAVMQDGGKVIPAFKHTNNQTSTSTGSHDREAADSDTDVGGND